MTFPKTDPVGYYALGPLGDFLKSKFKPLLGQVQEALHGPDLLAQLPGGVPAPSTEPVLDLYPRRAGALHGLAGERAFCTREANDGTPARQNLSEKGLLIPRKDPNRNSLTRRNSRSTSPRDAASGRRWPKE